MVSLSERDDQKSFHPFYREKWGKVYGWRVKRGEKFGEASFFVPLTLLPIASRGWASW
jgi:hypothetical protein